MRRILAMSNRPHRCSVDEHNTIDQNDVVRSLAMAPSSRVPVLS
jgi:hypothetical protein